MFENLDFWVVQYRDKLYTSPVAPPLVLSYIFNTYHVESTCAVQLEKYGPLSGKVYKGLGIYASIIIKNHRSEIALSAAELTRR